LRGGGQDRGKSVMNRSRHLVFIAAVLVAASIGGTDRAVADRLPIRDVLQSWYRLSLELVRHTPTHPPPVAARTFAYLGVGAYEAVASGNDALRSLAGQLNGLKPVPARIEGRLYDDAVVLQATLAAIVGDQ